MISLRKLHEAADLLSEEIFLFSLEPREKHVALLASYTENLWRGEAGVRDLIVKNIHEALEMGARLRAADLILVLRMFLEEHPHVDADQTARVSNIAAGEDFFACWPSAGEDSPHLWN